MESPSFGTLRPETPLLEDPWLGATMLPSTGEGEKGMTHFIQDHMVSILQPLAETVTDIQRSIAKIKENTSLANGLAERNMEHIAAHEQKLVLFGSGLSRINEDILSQRNELHETMDRIVTLEGDHDATKVSMSRTEGYIQKFASSEQDSKKVIEDLDTRIRQVQLSISETNVSHMGFEDRLSEIRNLHDGLNDRHMQMMTSLQQVSQSDENTRAMMKRHMAACDKQKKDAQRSFTLCDDRLKSVEAMLLETTHKTHNNAKSLKSLSTDVKHMLAELGEVTGMQQSMTDAKSEKNDRVDTMNSVKSDRSAERGPSQQFGNRMGRIEEQLAAMDRKQAFEKESHTVWKKEIDDMVKKSMTETRDNSLQLEMTTKQCKTQEEKLLRNESRVVAAESNIEKLQKAIDKCESDGRDLALNLKELTSQVELEKNEHKKTVASVDNAHADVGSTNEEIKLMSKDISDIQGALSKIAMRLELAHEYVQGLGKGFQDTHKRVTAGLDGMVAPKTVSNRKMLPEIPGKLRSEVSSPSPAPPSVGPQ